MDREHRHAGLLAVRDIRDDRNHQRADERRHLAGQCEQAEILRDAIFRCETDQQCARRSLQRTAGRADQATEQLKTAWKWETSAPAATGTRAAL